MFNPLTKLFRSVSNKQSALCIGDLPDGDNQRATSSSSLFQTWKSGSQHTVKHWYKEALGMQASSCSGDSLSRPKVVSKMNRAFSEARSIMVLHYCGDADEQGDWVLPQGGGSITLNSICAVWEQQRKAHTRLLIVADCPNSFHWVAALAAMPKSNALRLNLCIQAAQATPDAHVSPGAFTLKWFSHHGGALSIQRRTAATMQQQDARTPGGAYHCTWGGESLHDFGVPLKFIAAHTSTDRVRGAGGTAPSHAAPVCGTAAAAAGTNSRPEPLPEIIDQINMQGWGQQSASGKPCSQHVALIHAKTQGLLAMSAPQQPLPGGSPFSSLELSQSNHLPAACTQLEPSRVAHGQQGPPALAGKAASADPVLVVQASRASVPSRCGVLMDDFDVTDRTLSDSVQVEWVTNRRRSEAPTPNHNFNHNHNHGHRGAYMLQSKADAADLELNKEELGRRLDEEAGRRLRIGRRGALHGEEDDPTDPNNDDVLPSLDGSTLDLPLLNTRPDRSTSATSALNTPVESATTLSPGSTPARAVQAGAGGKVSSSSLHSGGFSGSHMSMDTIAPQPQFASGAPGPSRLARVTSAHRVQDQDTEAACSAAHPAPGMASSPAPLHGATRLATPRPSSFPQWELSSELLQLAPNQSNIPESRGTTSASSVALSQPTDFDFISFGSPAMPVSPQAARNVGIQGIDIELISFPQSPLNGWGQGRGAQLSPCAAAEPLPPMVGGSQLAGVSGSGGVGSPIKASAASVCEMLRDLSGSVCSPSNQLLRYVLDANDSADDHEGSSHRDADNRRGRRQSLQGGETSSFFADDGRWGIRKEVVRKEPELVAEVESMQVKAPLPHKPMVSPFLASQGPPSRSSSNQGASSSEATCSTHMQQPQSAGNQVGSLGGRLSSGLVHPRIAAALARALSGMRGSSGRPPSNQLLQYVLHASDSTIDREGEGTEQRRQGRSGRRVELEGDEADGDLFADDAVRWALLQSLVKGDGELEEEVQLLQRNSMRWPPSAGSMHGRQHTPPSSQLPRGGSGFSSGGCALAADGSSPSPSEAICLMHPKLVAGLADALAGIVQGPACPSTKLVKHVQQASMMMFEGEEEEGDSSDRLAVAGGPCARRGRRLELDGDEIASAVFGDDKDKWEAVKLIVRGQPGLEAEVEGLMNDQDARWPEVQVSHEWATLTLVDGFPVNQVQSERAGVAGAPLPSPADPGGQQQEGVVQEAGSHTAASAASAMSAVSRGQGAEAGVGAGRVPVPSASAGQGGSWSLEDLEVGDGSRGTPHLGDPCTCTPTPGVGGARTCWAEQDGPEQAGPGASVASVSAPQRVVSLTPSSSARSSAEWPQEPPPPPRPDRAATTSCVPTRGMGGEPHGEQLHPSFLGTSIVTDLLASLPQDGWAAGGVGGVGAGGHGCPINTLDRLLMEQGRRLRQFDPSVKSITEAAASTVAAEGAPTTSAAAGPTSH